MRGSKGKLPHFIERTSFGNTTKNPRIQQVTLEDVYIKKKTEKNLKGDTNKKLLKKKKKQRKQYYWVSRYKNISS